MFRSKLIRAGVARWGRATRAMTLGVRVAAIDGEGRALLVRHGYAPGWHFPGGAVEIGETSHDAAVRELVEETGVTALGAPRLFGLYFNPAFGGRDHVALFVADAFERGPEPSPNREIAEIGWFARDALPDDATPATRRRLAEIAGGGAPAARW